MFFLPEKSLNKKILEIMQKDPRCQYTATMLDRLFYKGKSEDYIKKKRGKEIQKITTELNRSLRRGKIVKHRRGYYSLKITPATLKYLENPPITVHGLKLECRSKQIYQNRIEGIPSQNNTFADDLLNWFKTMRFKETTNNRYFRDVPFEGRWIKLTIHIDGLIEIFVNCSDFPLTYPAMSRLCSYLNGFLERVFTFSKWSDVMVRQIGAALDYQDLRLEGISCITLHKYMNDWSKIYYKESIGAVRIERHLTCTISLEQAMNTLFLLNNPPPTNGNGHGEDTFEDVV